MEGIDKISSGGVVYAVEDEENRKEVEKLKNPEFSDTGNVAGINSFPDFLAKVKSKMDIFGFWRDFKAGMQFVLHAGQIVNNCVSDRADLPLAAKQGKVLAEELAKLNSDIGTDNAKISLRSNDSDIAATIIDKNNSDAFYIGYVKSTNDYHVNFRKNNTWSGEQKLVTNSDIIVKSISAMACPTGVTQYSVSHEDVGQDSWVGRYVSLVRHNSVASEIITASISHCTRTETEVTVRNFGDNNRDITINVLIIKAK